MRLLSGCAFAALAGLFVLCNAGIIILAVPDVFGIVLCAIAAGLPAAAYVFLILRLDRFEHEPFTMVALAFFWGALVATVFAFVLNTAGGVFLQAFLGEGLGDFLTGGFIAPIVEETLKGLALIGLLIVFRREFDNVTDGILYGSLIGLGFAMTENIVYFGRSYVEGGVFGVGILFYLRVMLSGLAHAIYTGTTGAGIGYLRERRDGLGVIVAIICFLLGIAQHALWNIIPATIIPALFGDSTEGALILLFIGFPLSALIFLGPGFFGLLLVSILSSRREGRIIVHHLAPELQTGIITQDDFRILASAWRRSGREFGLLFSQGPAAWQRQRQFHQLATELAFSRHHAERGEFRDVQPRPEDDYRARLVALRQTAA